MQRFIFILSLFLILPCAAYSQIPNGTAGLISIWHFDETSGDTADDGVGTNNAGPKSCSWVTGKYSNGIQTDAVTDIATCTVAGYGINNATEFSFSYWIKFIGAFQATYNDFWDNWNGSERNTYGNYISLGGQQRIQFNVTTNGAATDMSYSCFLSTGQYYNMVFTWKQNNFACIYLDGVWVSSVAVGNVTVNDAAGTGYIFNDYNLNRGAVAIYDDWAIWSKALTPAEVVQVYSNSWSSTVEIYNAVINGDME